MRLRTVLLSFAVFCICMLVLAAEIWIYVLAKPTSLAAVLLFALMILTGAVGIVVPLASMIGAVMKKPQGRYFLLLPIPPFIFTGEKRSTAGAGQRPPKR